MQSPHDQSRYYLFPGVKKREKIHAPFPSQFVLRQNSPSVPKTDDPQPSTSSQIQPPQESAKSNIYESESDQKGNLPKTHPRLKELLFCYRKKTLGCQKN